MKIALINAPITPFNLTCSGGTERAMIYQMEQLIKRDIKVSIFAGSFINNEKYSEYTIQVPYKKHCSKIKQSLSYAQSCSKLTQDYDINHVTSYYQFPKFFNAKNTLMHIHYYWPKELTNEDKERLSEFNLVFVSRFMREYFLELYPFLKPDKCHLIYNGVDTDLFHSIERGPNPVINFGFASQWSRKKGFYVLLEAIRILERKRKDFRVSIAGGPDLWACIGSFKKWRIDHRFRRFSQKLTTIDLVGLVPHHELPKFYNQLDVMIVPSVWKEPFGMVAAESLSCGRPVIASRIGGLPEIVNDANGTLVEPGDPQALADAMEYYIDHPNVLKTKSEAARESVITQLSWDRHMDEIMGIYELMLKNV